MIEVKVPVLPESISEATVAVWHKKIGDFVELMMSLSRLKLTKLYLRFPQRIQAY